MHSKNGVVVGAFPEAFRLRPGEADLSVGWIEHFDGTPEEQIANTVWSFRNGYFKDASKGTGENAAFAKGNVGSTVAAAAKHGATIKVVHFPTKADPGHSGIRRLPREDATLRARLASEVFTTMIPNASIPAKP